MCRCCIMLTYFVYKLVGWVAFAPVLVTPSGMGAVALCPLLCAVGVSRWVTSPSPHTYDACGLSHTSGCCQHAELWCGFAQPLHWTNT